ncbi:MAG: hypothetical protein QMC87_00835 [Methanothermobacter thermautotrophicus]|nr:hypothetical protein [Methanothermobacter thermautotrophicus]
MRSLLAVLILAVVLSVASFSPVFAAVSPSSTQQLEAEVEPTIAIGAFWMNGANNSTIYLLDLLADNQEYSWEEEPVVNRSDIHPMWPLISMYVQLETLPTVQIA